MERSSGGVRHHQTSMLSILLAPAISKVHDGWKPRHRGAKGLIPSDISHFCAQSVRPGHGHRPFSEYPHSQTSRNAVVAEENQQSSLPAQPCLVICPLHCRGSSGNTAAVPDGTSKKSQLRGPADSHLYSPTHHSKERRGASVSFFSHPKEINMLCKNNSIQQSSTLHLPPSGPSLLAFH